MDSHTHELERAQTAWRELSDAERSAAFACLDSSASGVLDREELCRLVLERLLAADSDLSARHAAAPLRQRDRLDGLIGRLVDTLLEGSGCTGAGAGNPTAAYAKQLLALVLPLLGPEDAAGGSALLRLLQRGHRHEALAPLARRRATSQLAGELLRAGGEELRAKTREILGADAARSAAVGEAAGDAWEPSPTLLLLSVDHTSLSCARYLAGLQRVDRDPHGFDTLKPGPSGRAKRVDQVTVKFEPPGSRAEGPPGDPPAGGAAAAGSTRESSEVAAVGGGASELKAKGFVALLSLAARAAADGRADGRQSVRLRDLLGMLGFVLGRGTNSDYYWRYYSEVVRYLLVDLPHRVVAMQVSFAGAKEPLVVFERLLPHALPLDERRLPLDAEGRGRLLEAFEEGEVSPSSVRQSGIAGFEIGFSPELLKALGLTRPMNAIEHVPLELLSLKGPAFWLAWQVAFLRRWARPPQGGGQGKPLLRVLRESGYLARYSRGGAVRYRDAVSAWWRDVGLLVGMGLLDEPGARLYGLRQGAWRDLSNEVSRSLDPGGNRLARRFLEELRVLFSVPARRLGQLEGARRRSRRLRGGGAERRSE